ncbi:hypothetical protein [Streptomyces dysideae]|uniref:Gram-positive cocci surface proteins LPxTG domain-containing protein n=1 Tax=Streptomyces dysideae TaxID=909626 RepID=A0A101UTE9_9ACTN|nr:hypothetical protein [Streptomyces dysideae]KUO16544.1 hypothetical protein AQJ91_35235 [Streptomyces dysideae]
MRSARMLLATATATAALAIAAPTAYAGDHDDDSSYSKEHGKDGKHDKHDKHDKRDKHDKPRGGMHTGGGALTAVNADDWSTPKDPKYDPATYRDKGSGDHDKDDWSGKHDKDSWSGEHDKPHGGMHTGGGALDGPGVTAGGLAVLAVMGTGVYALRRKKASEGAA